MAIRVVEAIYRFKDLIFYQLKDTGKMTRAQGKHREFSLNQSVATLRRGYLPWMGEGVPSLDWGVTNLGWGRGYLPWTGGCTYLGLWGGGTYLR